MDMAVLRWPAAQAYRALEINRVCSGHCLLGQDRVAEEVPVALEFNGVSHAVMMATPADLEDFAYGFATTECIVDAASEIYDCESTSSSQGWTVHLTIAASCFARLKEKRRNLIGRTGCGLCGTESLSHAVRQVRPLTANPCFDRAAVTLAVASFRAHQPLLAVTGATHAAAWCTADGCIGLIREDVGRHNALDKLVGALLRARLDASRGFIIISSRASYEMVQKTATVGIALLAAMSGVTGLAVDLAQDAGLTLLGFARGTDYSIYSHPERLSLEKQMAPDVREDNLIRMANQIGTFFDSMPDQKEAREGIAQHLKKFWDPRMRRNLMARADGPERAQFLEIVLLAVREHRDWIV